MAQDTKRQILMRAFAIIGDSEALANQLRVPRVRLDRWLSGFVETPDEVLLRAVDIIYEEQHMPPMPPWRSDDLARETQTERRPPLEEDEHT
jgi:hypothetical protein